MRLGVVVRSDCRGLAYLTQDFARHMPADSLLVVHTPNPRFPSVPLPDDLALIPQTHVDWSAVDFTGKEWLDWLDGLDVVYTAETPYDWTFYEECRKRKVRSVCHVMPEFDKFTGANERFRPDHVWVPTWWRNELVDGARIVPVPVPAAPRPRLREKAETFVFVRGSNARPDRAGWLSVLWLMRHGPRDIRWIVYQQENGDMTRPDWARTLPHVELRGAVKDRWELYDEADVLVAPRRFGGLSLPVLEATACCLPSVTLSTDPMAEFTSWRIRAVPAGRFTSGGGPVDVWEAQTDALLSWLEAAACNTIRLSSTETQRRAFSDGWDGSGGRAVRRAFADVLR